MVGITRYPVGGAGLLNLLQAANSGNAGASLLSAISGNNAASTGTAGNILNTLTPGATSTSIDGLLQQQKLTSRKNALYASVAQRLDYMQQGKYDPKANWEKVAAYAMQTGQPMVVSLDDKGSLQAAPQGQADLSKYNVQQRRQLLKAIDDIGVMAGKIQANKGNQKLIDKLAGAETDLALVAGGNIPAQSDWESQGSLLMTMHKSFKIALDPKGNLMVQDQATAPMDDLPLDQQKVLRDAVAQLPGVLGSNGTITTQWQADAKAMSDAGVPFFLDVDPTTLDYGPQTDNNGYVKFDNNGHILYNKGTPSIVVKENSGENITPAFLKEAPYAKIGDDTPLLKQAAKMIKDGKPFFLDFDSTGRLAVKDTSAQNLIKYNTPTQSLTNQFGSGSILSLFA